MVQQPALEPLRRWDPERIGPYVLLGRLGAGAMGQVYLGRSAAGRMVAVKTIKIELAEESGFRDHFAHEVAAARRVSGVFTASVVAADPEADVPWLATAYIPAPSLSGLVRSCGPQPVATIRWLAAGCAEALESIHGAGLVHRDLKPSNVLVAPDGPRVIDFGVARAAERIQLTVTRGAVGTPAYMAPEQARDTRQASMASDVFALGATLLFAATGHAPYQGEAVMDVLVRLATEPPDLTGLPAELSDVITACLERSPRDRPTSAALLARLEPFVAGPPDTEAGHSFLGEPVMALIAEYQRRPQLEPAARAGEASEPSSAGPAGEDGATYASDPALPAQPAPAARGRTARQHGPPGRPGPLNRTGRPGRPGQPGRRHKHEAFFTLAGRAGAAILLVGAGSVMGALLTGLGSGARTGTVSASVNPAVPPPGGPPPGAPPFALPSGRTARPAILVSQPSGDGNTVFVVHSSGWPPGSRMSVRLAGDGTSRVSPIRPVTDRTGTFNYAIDQGHLFFAGLIPAGKYRVIVTGPGHHQVQVPFQVLRPPAGAPPSPRPSTS